MNACHTLLNADLDSIFELLYVEEILVYYIATVLCHRSTQIHMHIQAHQSDYFDWYTKGFRFAQLVLKNYRDLMIGSCVGFFLLFSMRSCLLPSLSRKNCRKARPSTLVYKYIFMYVKIYSYNLWTIKTYLQRGIGFPLGYSCTNIDNPESCILVRILRATWARLRSIRFKGSLKPAASV